MILVVINFFIKKALVVSDFWTPLNIEMFSVVLFHIILTFLAVILNYNNFIRFKCYLNFR